MPEPEEKKPTSPASKFVGTVVETVKSLVHPTKGTVIDVKDGVKTEGHYTADELVRRKAAQENKRAS